MTRAVCSRRRRSCSGRRGWCLDRRLVVLEEGEGVAVAFFVVCERERWRWDASEVARG